MGGPRGEKGATGVQGIQGQTGVQGIQGIKGEKGEKGEKGNDGTGLTLKSFKIGNTYHYGDYVFAKSSNSTSENHNSMWIAQKTEFVAKTEPYNDVESGNWAEFQAPRGEKGEKGDHGERGATGAIG